MATNQAAAGAAAPKRRINYSTWTPLAALIVLIIISALASPYFLAPRNLLNITRQISYTGIIALGMTLIIIAGGIDLSVGSLVALAGGIAILALNALGGGPAGDCRRHRRSACGRRNRRHDQRLDRDGRPRGALYRYAGHDVDLPLAGAVRWQMAASSARRARFILKSARVSSWKSRSLPGSFSSWPSSFISCLPTRPTAATCAPSAPTSWWPVTPPSASSLLSS